MRVTPPRAAAAPTIAYRPGVTQMSMSGQVDLTRSEAAFDLQSGGAGETMPTRWRLAQDPPRHTHWTTCSVSMPTARPKVAPTAMVGINKPAGTCGRDGVDMSTSSDGGGGGWTRRIRRTFTTLMPKVKTVMNMVKRQARIRRPAVCPVLSVLENTGTE